jgi:hypothetical protein
MEGTALPSLRALKGPPLCVAIALYVSSRPMGTKQLATITGYGPNTVSEALRVLAHCGVAQNHARYNGWTLTHDGQQLLSPAPEEARATDDVARAVPSHDGDAGLPRHEPRISRLAHSCSSCSDLSGKTEEQQLPPPRREAKTLATSSVAVLPPPWDDVLSDLVKICSIPHYRAHQALRAARQRGDLPSQVLYHALLWYAYCQEPENSTITNHAYFIAARIEDGTPSPKQYRPPDHSKLWARITHARRRWTEEIAGQYGGTTEG